MNEAVIAVMKLAEENAKLRQVVAAQEAIIASPHLSQGLAQEDRDYAEWEKSKQPDEAGRVVVQGEPTRAVTYLTERLAHWSERALRAEAVAKPVQDYRVYKDGDQWCAVGPDFIDLQQSPAGFADTPGEALEALMQAFGKRPTA